MNIQDLVFMSEIKFDLTLNKKGYNMSKHVIIGGSEKYGGLKNKQSRYSFLPFIFKCKRHGLNDYVFRFKFLLKHYLITRYATFDILIITDKD